jgi:ABC-type molybdate transport system permease subunit
MDSGSELGKFLYLLINLGLIVAALVLKRALFVIFGGLGCMGYVGHLAYRIFADSMLFTVALTIVGISMIALGIIYQRNRGQVERTLRARIPGSMRALIPARARG